MQTERSGWAFVVRSMRKRYEMTQAQLADAAGVSIKTITNIEAGTLTPQSRTLRSVRLALGLPEDLEGAKRMVLAEVENADRPPVPADRQLEGRIFYLEKRVQRLERMLIGAVAALSEDTLSFDELDFNEAFSG